MRLFQELGKNFDGPDDVGDGAAAGEIGDDMIKTLEDGACDGETGELFKNFVDEVAGIEVGGDEDVGLAGDLVGFGVGEGLTFVEADARIDCCVELHFSGDDEAAILESF